MVGTSETVDVDNPELSVAVFWVTGGEAPGAQNVLTEQPGTALRAEFYRSFELKLYDEPEGPSLLRTSSGARYGVARLGAYRDENGNGVRDEAEPLLGLSNGRLLLRVPEALTARESPTGAHLAAGWYVVSAPLSCPAAGASPAPGGTSEPVADGDRGVPLGATCRSDAECGAGVCVREFMGPWPGGACDALPGWACPGCASAGLGPSWGDSGTRYAGKQAPSRRRGSGLSPRHPSAARGRSAPRPRRPVRPRRSRSSRRP